MHVITILYSLHIHGRPPKKKIHLMYHNKGRTDHSWLRSGPLILSVLFNKTNFISFHWFLLFFLFHWEYNLTSMFISVRFTQYVVWDFSLFEMIQNPFFYRQGKKDQHVPWLPNICSTCCLGCRWMPTLITHIASGLAPPFWFACQCSKHGVFSKFHKIYSLHPC